MSLQDTLNTLASELTKLKVNMQVTPPLSVKNLIFVMTINRSPFWSSREVRGRILSIRLRFYRTLRRIPPHV